MDLNALGTFDVVLYLGVLYHMKDPLESLERVAAVTQGVAIMETEAVEVAGLERVPLWEFFQPAELNRDVSNWWAPNEAGLLAACRRAGFSRAEGVAGPPWRSMTQTARYLARRLGRVS